MVGVEPEEDVVGDVRLGAISVDCPDPAGLGDFYKNVLGLEVMFSSALLTINVQLGQWAQCPNSCTWS